MDPTTHTKEGHDYQFVEEPPSGLKCTICQAVARQPQQHGECGKLFCMSCLTQYRLTSSKCPNCALQLVTFYDGKSEEETKALRVRCNELDNGCQWTGALGSLHTHLKNCPNKATISPNQCSQQILPLYEDYKKEHSPRLDQGPGSKEYRSHEEESVAHIDISPKGEQEYATQECSKAAVQCEPERCLRELLSCKYADLGCTAQLTRLDLQTHKEDNQLHLQITKEKVSELTQLIEARERRFREHTDQMDKEIATLRQSLPALHIPTAPIVFAVSNFYENQLLDKTVYSPSFQLCNQGYAFVLIVFPKGRGDGKYSHVSVFVRLMKGDSDDSLSWPFQGEVTVEILNQLEDKNHRKRKIVFPDDQDIICRPMEGEENRGCGYNKFVSMKALGHYGYKSVNILKMTNCTFAYLKNSTAAAAIDL